MLKFINQQKTSARFFDAFFSLAAPEDWNSIGDGPTREKVKAWLTAGNTPEPADHEPAPIDQADIDNLEKQMKALAMTFAQITNTPIATVRTIFRNKMEILSR